MPWPARTIEERFWSKVEPELNSGCWLWSRTTNPQGYGHFNIDGTIHVAHRVAWVLSRGEIADGLLLCHKCDTPACVNPDHIFLGTAKDNARDMSRKGRGRTKDQVGEANGNAKLSAEAVREIRQRLRAGTPRPVLQRQFNVGQTQVARIATGASWGHLL